MSSSIVLGSGGVNSAVVAAQARRAGDVFLLHIDYGQRAAGAQREAVSGIADTIGASFVVADLGHVKQVAQMSRPADGPVEAASPADPEVVSLTAQFGLARMPTMLSVAVQFAQRLGADVIRTGASELSDERETESAPGEGTPERRREFFYLFNLMLEQLQRSRKPIRLETPLIDLSRDEIIKLGDRYKVPFDLTYSCEAGDRPPCGVCPSCLARQEAFRSAELLDPASLSVAQSAG
jgi:7-cyano-7-deazaguanine synthase